MWLRLIILFLAIWLIARFIRKLLARDPAAGNGVMPRMVRCEYCGLFLPENETIVSGNHFYCCKQHESASHK
jgi:uncharacterized protein